MKVIDTGIADAAANMDRDASLLKELAGNQEALLHFYEWDKPSATYGYFANPSDYLRSGTPLALARRPTGGGIIFHLTDLAFSVLVPASHPHFSTNTLDNYRFINERVAEALKQFERVIDPTLLAEEPTPLTEACCGFCMAKPTQYDVMVDGKKVGGGAQRRTRHGYLHQGSISLALPEQEVVEAYFKPGLGVWEAMRENSYALLGAGADITEAKRRLRECLAGAFRQSCR